MSHIAPLIRDLALISAIAGIVALLFQRLKQPVVLGYILAGVILGPYTPPAVLVSDIPNIQILAELGVVFVMFTLGLEFTFHKLVRVSGTAGTAGFIEVLFALLASFGLGKAMGWSTTDSVFLGAMLSISSTTIILKALDELGLKSRRFAEVVFGILIVEDLLAILLLVGLTVAVGSGRFSPTALASATGQLVLVVGSWFLAGYFLLPRFVRWAGRMKSDETLVLIAIGLCLGLVVIASQWGYSPALGAFIMGSILAESTESHRISDLMGPLRDLFAAIFFVSVGMLMNPQVLLNRWPLVLGLSVWVIFIKSLAPLLGTLVAGRPLKTSVLVGTSLGQVGEFSFIIAALGLNLKVMSPYLYPVIVAVSVVTAFTTPYLIRGAPGLVKVLERRLPLRLQAGIQRYAEWRERRQARPRNPELGRRILRWFINGFVTSALTLAVARWGLPLLAASGWSLRGVRLVAWGVAMLFAAPFIWAMFSSFLRSQRAGLEAWVPWVFHALTLVWVSMLSLQVLPRGWVFYGLAASVLLLVWPASRGLGHSYRWFEENLLSTFALPESDRTAVKKELNRQLAPWDRHLVRLKVHANAEMTGRTLAQTELRNRHGVNIVAIQRGERTLVAPSPDERLFPKDELLVLASDEQIDLVRARIEQSDPGLLPQSIESYELRSVAVENESEWVGQTLREVGFRDRHGSMVVGVERGKDRILNPDSEFRLKSGDLVWLVGQGPDATHPDAARTL